AILYHYVGCFYFFFSSRRRHTRFSRDWSSDVCSSDLVGDGAAENPEAGWSGGFDVVLGNPPWERVKLKDKQFFASRAPELAAARSEERRVGKGCRPRELPYN